MKLKHKQQINYFQRTETGLSGSSTLSIVSRAPRLTEREQETLHHLAEGYTSDQIAQMLYLSTETVTSHRKSLIKKMGVPNVAAAVAFAFRHKLIQ